MTAPDSEILSPEEALARLASINSQIDSALKKSGRTAGDCKLLAVSKTFPSQAIEIYRRLGQLDFGESYIQEAKEKIPSLGHDINWHLIGHLQTNKAKYAASLFDTLHALDSLELAAELDRRLKNLSRTMNVYVQVNVSGEDSKSGLAPSELPGFLQRLSAFDSLVVVGLMSMPPYDPDPEVSRPYFSALRQLRDKEAPALKGLSMGMSGDFLVAISEGATVVRVGTALFGSRSQL
jgi:pyridoxal phosphate enzyme (YggS family)